jgi:hypothetical protein
MRFVPRGDADPQDDMVRPLPGKRPTPRTRD